MRKRISSVPHLWWLVAASLAACADLLLAVHDAAVRAAMAATLKHLWPRFEVAAQSLFRVGITHVRTDFLDTAVSAVFQVAITLLGLYFAAISVVASTSYRGIYVSVRTLLVEETRSRRLLASMVFLASYSGLVLLALACGAPLGFCTGLVLVVFSLWLFRAFLHAGLELLEYLDPQRALAQQPALLAAEIDRGPATWKEGLRPKLAQLPGLVEVARQAADAGALTRSLSATLGVFVRFRKSLAGDITQMAQETIASHFERRRLERPAYIAPEDYIRRAEEERAPAAETSIETSTMTVFQSALCKLADAIYAANDRTYLAETVSQMLSAGSACAYMGDAEGFLLWDPFWRQASDDSVFALRPDLHNLKARMLCAPIVSAAAGTFAFVKLCREKLADIVSDAETELLRRHPAGLAAALQSAIAWAEARQGASVFEPLPDIKAVLDSCIASHGAGRFYTDADLLQKRLKLIGLHRNGNFPLLPLEQVVNALLKAQFLDSLANHIEVSIYLQGNSAEILMKHVAGLLTGSLQKEQTDFFHALADDSAAAGLSVLAAVQLYLDSVQELLSAAEAGPMFFDPPIRNLAPRSVFSSSVFAEEVIWAGAAASATAITRASVIRKAAQWVGSACRGPGNLTTDFIERIFRTVTEWFHLHAEDRDFCTALMNFLSMAGQLPLHAEVWQRDDSRLIFAWTQGLKEWEKAPRSTAAVSDSLSYDRSRWDLYGGTESLVTDLKEKGIVQSADNPAGTAGWANPAEHPDLYDHRPILRVLAANDWSPHDAAADLFGVVLARRIPAFADAIPESSKRLLGLLDQSGIR